MLFLHTLAQFSPCFRLSNHSLLLSPTANPPCHFFLQSFLSLMLYSAVFCSFPAICTIHFTYISRLHRWRPTSAFICAGKQCLFLEKTQCFCTIEVCPWDFNSELDFSKCPFTVIFAFPVFILFSLWPLAELLHNSNISKYSYKHLFNCLSH